MTGVYFAHARLYDADLGRMLSKDPVKRGLNGYPYCGNDPVNHTDPTGEIPTVLLFGAGGGILGGIAGFAGSALDQLSSGDEFSLRRALGSAANGMVTGAVKGALIGSGAGIPVAFGADFAAGAAGNLLEQAISGERVTAGRGILGGLSNAVSGAIFGNVPFKNAGEAFGKGALAGAATSGLGYLSDLAGRQPKSGQMGHFPGGAVARTPYERLMDPRGICILQDVFGGGLGIRKAYGYRYEMRDPDQPVRDGFDLGDFLRSTLTGGLMGGLSGVAFFGVDKAVGALKGSLSGGGKGESKYDLYRKESNAGNYKDLDELMQLRNVKNVANKAGIGLEGIKVKIDRNPELLGRNVYGYTDGKTITLYPDAFTNTETLVRTLGHERIHVYQVGVFGKPTSTDILGEFERGASMSEQSWWDYFNFRNGGQ